MTKKKRQVSETKYRFQMERRIDKNRGNLKELIRKLEENGAPASCVSSVRRAVSALDMADAKLN